MTAATTDHHDHTAVPDPAAGWTPWRWLLAVVVAGLGVAATWGVWDGLIYLVRYDDEASHIVLVPIIVAWLAFIRRSRVAVAVVRGQWVGVALVGLGWALHTVGDANLMLSVWQVSAVVVLVGALVAVLGTDLFRLFGPAVAVLIFLVPLPARARQAVTLPMQTYAAQATEAVLSVVGTGVERQGNLLEINGTPVTVAEACNGLRMTHALVLVAVAFAFAAPYRSWLRALVLVLSPMFAVVCNVVRLVPTVWAYGAFDAETADLLHDLGGWAMLFVGYFMLTGVVWLLEYLGLPTQRAGGRVPAAAAVAGRRRPLAVAAAAVLVAGIAAEQVYWGTEPGDARPFHARIAAGAEAIPVTSGPWIGRDVPVPTQAQNVLNATAIVSRTYQQLTDGRRVGLLLVHVQDNRNLLGHYPPRCYPNQAWEQLSAEPAAWAVDGEEYRGVRYEFRPPGVAGQAPPVTILNFLTAPGGVTLRDMDELEALVSDRSRLHYGAGQLQLLFYGGEDRATQDEVMAQFLRLSRPMLAAMLAELDTLPAAD